MGTRLNPYLIFDGTAREALEAYHAVFGGDLDLTTYLEGGLSRGSDDESLIMHGHLTTPAGLVLMAADSPAGEPAPSGSAISISVSGDDETELRGYFDGLLGSGTVEMPLERAPWGELFGQGVDRFGVTWMVSVTEPT